jgi:hypothetical protein
MFATGERGSFQLAVSVDRASLDLAQQEARNILRACRTSAWPADASDHHSRRGCSSIALTGGIFVVSIGVAAISLMRRHRHHEHHAGVGDRAHEGSASAGPRRGRRDILAVLVESTTQHVGPHRHRARRRLALLVVRSSLPAAISVGAWRWAGS